MSPQSIFLPNTPPLRQVSFILTDAQIKLLPTTNFVLVITDPAGTSLIVPIAAVARSNFEGGEYTNATNGLLYIGYDGGTEPKVGLNPIIWDDFNTNSGNRVGVMGIRSVPFDSPFETPASATDAGPEFLDVVMRLGTDEVAPLTGGNAANTIKVTLTYMLLDVASGEFI